MGKRNGTYEADFPLGTTVRVAQRSELEAFMTAWKWHHPLEADQLPFADQNAEVINVAFYHGGDELYTLKGIPGLWHEACLRDAVPDTPPHLTGPQHGVAPLDTDGVPRGFKRSTLGLDHLLELVELPVEELISKLARESDLCDKIIGQSYDKRYTPSTFIEGAEGAFRVGWYENGYQAVRTYPRRELAVADYLLFSFGKGRLPPSAESEHIIRTAQRYADEIVRGVVSPYDGGRRIWKECQLELKSSDHRLDPFVYWSSEYEDTANEERRALCDKALRHAAALLIETGSAV